MLQEGETFQETYEDISALYIDQMLMMAINKFPIICNDDARSVQFVSQGKLIENRKM